MRQKELELLLEKLELSAFGKGGEQMLQSGASKTYEDAQDRLCAYWDKVQAVMYELAKTPLLHPKAREVITILCELLDKQCSLKN